ncbi:MAG: hypothetical protein GX632_03430 [Propioniciclava sp.]|nr:hypothetical protein [Propioniciclava sp.]
MDDPQLRSIPALRSAGWTPYQVRRAVAAHELVRLTRRVYTPARELSPRDEHLVRAAALLSTHRDSVVLSHASAAIAHGLAVQVDNPRLVDLTTPPPGRGRRTATYHLHCARFTADDVVTVGDLRVTSLARTVVDLARTAQHAWAVVAADQALARDVSRDSLLAVVQASKGMTGVEQARQVIAFADGRSESVAESVSRVMISRTGLPQPVPQFRVEVDGLVVARGDFGWEDWNLIGEVDGKVKYRRVEGNDQSPEDVMVAQNRRQESIRQAGFWVTRWGWAQAWSVSALGKLLRTALERQGWRP